MTNANWADTDSKINLFVMSDLEQIFGSIINYVNNKYELVFPTSFTPGVNETMKVLILQKDCSQAEMNRQFWADYAVAAIPFSSNPL